MDTINRNKGDLNSQSFAFKSNLSSKQQVSISSSNTEKTKSLSIISNNHISLVLKDISALDDLIDGNLFDEQFKFESINSERKEFDSIDQIENQRLLIEYSLYRLIKIGMLINNQQIIVIKEMLFQSEEEFIKMMDEFKIQNKLNNLFPKQSLQLIKPVKVSKQGHFYKLYVAMEKAETYLFLYSQKNKISSNQTYTIYRVILKQLINMHSIQIAHRDVKPQNIFYVIDKGWLLSDFGESQEYQELEQFYNIRGTLYFIMPNIQKQVHLRKQILQNLLANDLYALVVSMIVIQKIDNIHYIDITQEIQNLNEYYLIETLKIKTYKELIEFEQQLDEVKEEIKYNNKNKYCKQLNSKEEQINQELNYASWIELCTFYSLRQIYPEITNQLFQLINNNIGKICNILTYGYVKLLEILYVSKKLINFEQIYFSNNIQSMRMEQLELAITLMFNFGYSETTLKYCELILMRQYNQFIHLKLIDCLERLLMFSEAMLQFKKFKQGLIFDQLNTENQQQFLLKLQYYQRHLLMDIDFDLHKLLIKQDLKQVYPLQFEEDIKQYNQFDNKDAEIIINLFKIYVEKHCGTYSVFSIYYVQQVLYIIQFYEINIESKSLEMIYDKRIEIFDSSRRTSILFDLGKIYCFQDKKVKLQKTIKLIQSEMFKAESWQQKITFQISILILKLNKMYSQNQTKHSQIKSNYITDRLYQLMLRINKVSFNLYISLIEEYLLYFLQIQHNNQCISLREIKIVIQIINFISKNKFYQKSFHMFQYYHVLIQSLLIMKYNHKRCLILIKDNEEWLSKTSLLDYKTQMKLGSEFRQSYDDNPHAHQQNQFQLFQFLQL